MSKQTPEGERIKESILGIILLLVLGCAFAGEFIGVHVFVGPTLLGLVLPDRSALAATLVDEVESFVTFAILPFFFLSYGLSTELHSINARAYFALQFLVPFGFSAKFLGITLVSVFYCDFVLKDAIILGLILSSIGITDVQFYRRSFQLELIDYRCFGVMITSSIVMAGFSSYVVKALYDPFRSVHNQEYVPTIINLLEASNPTRESQMCINLLHLIELAAGVSPAAVHQSWETRYHRSLPRRHHPHVKPRHSLYKPTESIINAFRIFERNNESLKPCLIIIPIHIKWNSGGIATESPEFRNVNLKVIDNAPCSVGILVDRGSQGGPRSVQGCWCLYRVSVLFIGGPDDREAVSCATRMANHPHVNVTVIRLTALLEIADNTEEKRLDSVTIHTFKKTNVTREKAAYKEEILADSAETCNLIHSMENEFDLILVGRRTESPLLLG
ncbi:Cation/H+ exchanger - like 10 [Theobroma cacao]|nr:Cation/H+ exchanger - like 10 [Theobroma cacao]